MFLFQSNRSSPRGNEFVIECARRNNRAATRFEYIGNGSRGRRCTRRHSKRGSLRKAGHAGAYQSSHLAIRRTGSQSMTTPASGAGRRFSRCYSGARLLPVSRRCCCVRRAIFFPRRRRTVSSRWLLSALSCLLLALLRCYSSDCPARVQRMANGFARFASHCLSQ